jgi:hypothetical protein
VSAGENTEPTPAEQLRSQSEKVEYVVSRRQELTVIDDGVEESLVVIFRDIATVSVPKRTQQRTILLLALSDAGIAAKDALEQGMRFRILDEEHAHAHGLKVKEPREPEIELA